MQNFEIVSDINSRLRLRFGLYAFDQQKAFDIQYYLQQFDFIDKVVTNFHNGSITINYTGEKDNILKLIKELDFNNISINKDIIYNRYLSDQEKQIQLDNEFYSKFRKLIVQKCIVSFLFPTWLAKIWRIKNSIPFIKNGLISLANKRLDVPVLDATSISASMLNGDFKSAGNIMFMLNISALLEEYTRNKTKLNLSQALKVNFDKLWIEKDGIEISINSNDLQLGDHVIVQDGLMIPVDGVVISGNALVNEASFTGEPLAKAVEAGASVFAGTVVEQGKIIIEVKKLSNQSRISRILDLIDTNESLKASIQANAEHLADGLVPYSFLSFGLLFALTRNLSRSISVLMVDYSCAIKLSTSIAIISAMKEASNNNIMVKGGKYLEAMASADTIVFDKTGTLTSACPKVKDILGFNGYSEYDVLKISACLEEHFPHSIANAVVLEAKERNIEHKEEHTKVNYIVAHGISTTINDQKAIIGSYHFVFEDEMVKPIDNMEQICEDLQAQGASTLLYLAINNELVGIISIYDPIKPESSLLVEKLHEVGFKNVVMLTGDCESCAAKVASQVGVDSYKSECLPEDKAEYIKQLRNDGHIVVMVGDGVNDTPALSSADLSISLQDSSDVARELADITLTNCRLENIILLRQLSVNLLSHIHRNYQRIAVFNSVLIGLGVAGVANASTLALLHNGSTFCFALNSTHKYLPD